MIGPSPNSGLVLIQELRSKHGCKEGDWTRIVFSFDWEEVRQTNFTLEVLSEEDEECEAF